MNSQSKGYAIVLYLIWPFSALGIGLKNFDSNFGRNLLIALFAFLGFTAIDAGDLEHYAARYYELRNFSFSELINLLLKFNVNRLFTDITAVVFSIFNNHHIYFAFLFGLFGYMLIHSLNILRLQVLKKSNKIILICFFTFATFYSIAAIFNLAFFTGGIYFLLIILKYIFYGEKKKYLILLLLTPIFHFGLTILLLIPVFYYLFKQRTNIYLIILLVFTSIPQSFITNFIESNLVKEDTVLEDRFNAYASDEGLEHMSARYKEQYDKGNSNDRILVDTRNLAHKFAVPILLLFLYANVRKVNNDKILLNLLNFSIAFAAITQLMLNISQGERFYLISGFITLSLLVYWVQRYEFRNFTFTPLLFISIPLILLYNLVSLIISKDFISLDFILSNVPILMYQMMFGATT